MLQEISFSFNHVNSTSDETASSTVTSSTTSSEGTFFLRSSNAWEIRYSLIILFCSFVP